MMHASTVNAAAQHNCVHCCAREGLLSAAGALRTSRSWIGRITAQPVTRISNFRGSGGRAAGRTARTSEQLPRPKLASTFPMKVQLHHCSPCNAGRQQGASCAVVAVGSGAAIQGRLICEWLAASSYAVRTRPNSEPGQPGSASAGPAGQPGAAAAAAAAGCCPERVLRLGSRICSLKTRCGQPGQAAQAPGA